MKKSIRYILLLAAMVAANAWAADDVTWDTYSDTWVAVDGLGRNVHSSADGLSTPKANKTVGMFYYICNGSLAGKNIVNITDVLAKDPVNPDWTNGGSSDNIANWWGQPVLDYYSTTEPYIFDHHLQMLMDAGVDFLFFDATNALTYDDAVLNVMKAIDRRAALGMKTPKLAYMLHSDAANTLFKLYLKFYCDTTKNKYWFTWQGKPLVLASADDVTTLPQKVQDHFTYRYSWAWLDGQKANQWAWLENYPQVTGWTASTLGTKIVEQISVSISQHASSKIGRSYHNGAEPTYSKYALCSETPYGLYYAEQWKRALAVSPPVVMITEFNEFTMGRYTATSTSDFSSIRPGGQQKLGESIFVDEYNQEFSRDIEPVKEPLIRDNYLMQTVDNIRQYKGVREIPTPSAAKTIKSDGDMSQWDNVLPEFRDDINDTVHRDANADNAYKSNTTGRNDIVVSKVTKNVDSLFFYVRTSKAISDMQSSNNWMRLYLNIDCNYTTGWNGYDYMFEKDSTTQQYTLMKRENNAWTAVTAVPVHKNANEMYFAVSKHDLNVTGECDIDFKWADNTQLDADILTFYTDGDVAPNGRFNYRYKGSVIPSGVESVGISPKSLNAVRHGDEITVTFNSPSNCVARIEVYDLQGAQVKVVTSPATAGDNKLCIKAEPQRVIVRAVVNGAILNSGIL
jgi:hypothetical protein